MQTGCADILSRIVEDLKDESEPYRRMVMETIDKVVSDLGTADVDARLEELLIDGILYAFQEQVGYTLQIVAASGKLLRDVCGRYFCPLLAHPHELGQNVQADCTSSPSSCGCGTLSSCPDKPELAATLQAL